MADPKKDGGKGGGGKDAKGGKDGKPAGGGGSKAPELFFFLIIIAGLLFVIVPIVATTFGFHLPGISSGTTGAGGAADQNSWSAVWDNFTYSAGRFFSGLLSDLIFTSIFLSLLFIMGIIYARFKISHVNMMKATEAAAKAKDSTTPHSFAAHRKSLLVEGTNQAPHLPGAVPSAPPENPRWVEVEQHMQSMNQSDWRLAILEADIMLYDMLDQMGYQGDSIGEKLKAVEPASFMTLDDAWRAHKVRNTIAHEGGTFVLSRSEAERTIKQFEKVFREFYYV